MQVSAKSECHMHMYCQTAHTQVLGCPSGLQQHYFTTDLLLFKPPSRGCSGGGQPTSSLATVC